jgi:hypothetical protein
VSLSDPEDPPPNAEPSDSTRRTDPQPQLEAEPTMADLLAAIHASDQRHANYVSGVREAMRAELDVTEKQQRALLEMAFTTLSGSIAESEKRLTEVIHGGLAALDRRAEQRDDRIRGALGELAKDVRAHREVLDEHQTKLKQILAVEQGRYDLEKAQGDEDQADRPTLTEAGQ